MTREPTSQFESQQSAVSIGSIWEKLKSFDQSAAVNDSQLLQQSLDLPVSRPAGIRESSSTNLTFLSSTANMPSGAIQCAALIAPTGFKSTHNFPVFLVDKPRLRFAQICNALFTKDMQVLWPYGAADKSKIHDSAQVSDHALLGANVQIGENTIVSAGAVIHSGTVIGSNCFISPGVVLGGTGFGYEQIDGDVVAFPHYGHVVIGNDVEIGANTCIDRGSLQDTVIMDGVKIDNLVHVAHNSTVRSGSLIIAGTVLCGSSDIGENAWIAPNAVIGESVSIGKNSLVGFATVVKQDLPDGFVATGNPPRVYQRAEK